MFVNRRRVHIEWGDCDPAGIVFYPRYFAMFDASTMMLFEAAGFAKQSIMANYDFLGWPMVDTRAKFILPSTFGDDIDIETRVTEFRRSSFDIQHRVFRGAELAIEATETRVWTKPHPDKPGALKATPVPEDIVAALSRD